MKEKHKHQSHNAIESNMCPAYCKDCGTCGDYGEGLNVLSGALKQKTMEENKATEVNPFGYFKPAEDALPLIQEVREHYTALHNFLLTLPGSRQRAVAITELETSAMWAIKGLVLNDPNSTQPNEPGVTGA